MDQKPKKLSSADEQIRVIREAKRRRARAFAMKKQGKSYRDIAIALGVSRGRAQQLVNQASDEAETAALTG